jgi:hypothetical protein
MYVVAGRTFAQNLRIKICPQMFSAETEIRQIDPWRPLDDTAGLWQPHDLHEVGHVAHEVVVHALLVQDEDAVHLARAKKESQIVSSHAHKFLQHSKCVY